MNIFTFIAVLLSSLTPVQDSDFAYNYILNGDVVSSQIVYRKSDNKYLYPKLKYNFTYDDAQRVIRKEVLCWDEQKATWIESHCFNYTFSHEGYELEHALWDRKSNDYTNIKERQVILDLNGMFTVSTFTWDHKNNIWLLKDNVQTFNSSRIYSYY